MSDFWSDPSSTRTSILHVCEQRRLWRDCTDAHARLSRWSPVISTIMSWAGSVHLVSSQSLNTDGRRRVTDDVATILLHLSLCSAAHRVSQNPITVHSLMLSSHLFFGLLRILAFTVPSRIVLAMPDDLEILVSVSSPLSGDNCILNPRSSPGL